MSVTIANSSQSNSQKASLIILASMCIGDYQIDLQSLEVDYFFLFRNGQTLIIRLVVSLRNREPEIKASQRNFNCENIRIFEQEELLENLSQVYTYSTDFCRVCSHFTVLNENIRFCFQKKKKYLTRLNLFLCVYIHVAMTKCFTLTLLMLNKDATPTSDFQQSDYLIWVFNRIHIFNDKQCRSRSSGFFRSQLIWIYTVC